MTLFRYLAYVAPLAVGFGVPAVLALTSAAPVRRRMVAALAVLGGVLVVLGAAALTESARAFGQVALLLAGLAVLVAGFFQLCAAFRLPPEMCQIVASLLVVALMSTVFCFPPVLEHALEVGMSGDDISRRITLALDVNPFMVMGYSIFGHELLHSPTFYRLDLADYQFAPPRWQGTALGYALAGFSLFAAALGLTALRLRFAK